MEWIKQHKALAAGLIIAAVGAYWYLSHRAASSPAVTVPATTGGTTDTSPVATGTTTTTGTGTTTTPTQGRHSHSLTTMPFQTAPSQVGPDVPVTTSTAPGVIPGSVPATANNSTVSSNLIGAGAEIAPGGAVYIAGTPSAVAAAGPQPAGSNFDASTNSYVPIGQSTVSASEASDNNAFVAANPGYMINPDGTGGVVPVGYDGP